MGGIDCNLETLCFRIRHKASTFILIRVIRVRNACAKTLDCDSVFCLPSENIHIQKTEVNLFSKSVIKTKEWKIVIIGITFIFLFRFNFQKLFSWTEMFVFRYFKLKHFLPCKDFVM